MMTLVYVQIMFMKLYMLIKTPNPIKLMSTLVIHSLLMVPIMVMMNPSQYIPYMMFLIMIGGIMILFSYMVSLSTYQESNVMKLNEFVSICVLTSLLMMSIKTTTMNTPSQSFNAKSVEMNQLNENPMNNPITSMFSMNMYTTLMSIMYLLLTLTSVMKLCLKLKKPMRQSYK